MRSYCALRWFGVSILLAWLVCSQGWADTHRWEPKAQAIPQVDHLHITGDWDPGDTATVTCNFKNVTVTVGATDTTDFVATALAAAINSNDTTEQIAAGTDDDLVGDETKNIGGQNYPEFKEFRADAEGSTVIITGRDGLPFIITTSDVGDGDISDPNNQQEATGPEHFDNPQNWDVGSLPVDGDIVRFDVNDKPCRYGLDYLFRDVEVDPGNAIRCDLEVTTDYIGYIGLPLWNPAGYVEYRDVDLAVGGWINDPNGTPTVVYKSIRFIPGVNGLGGAIVRLNLSSRLVKIDIADAGTATTSPRVFIRGSSVLGSTTAVVQKGSVVFDSKENPPTTVSSYSNIAIGVRGQPNDQTRVWFESDTDLASNGKLINVYSGNVIWRGQLIDGGGDSYIINQYDGVFTYQPNASDPLYTTNIYGGIFRWISPGNTSQQGNVLVGTGGTYDITGATNGLTFTGTLTARSGAKIKLGGNAPSIIPVFTGPGTIIIEP